MMKFLLSVWGIFMLSTYCPAQLPYPTNYFGSPIGYEITLAGNFGEIRPDHFHSGLDIKTNGREGIPVYAVADGYVSRINISPFGYGKALYITHPNGYTSVYAHLRSFNTGVDSIVKSFQYKKESFELDTLLPPAIFVKKGELIGFSGNTGSSEGPHLHFEIRDTKTEEPINPLLFGYQVKDDVAPEIVSLTVYPLGKSAYINGERKIKKMEAIPDKEYYRLGKWDTITAHGNIGFGIECNDKQNGSGVKNAVFSIELQTGGKQLYYAEFDKFSFENSRYVNAYIDYAEKEGKNIKIQKCFVSKNNQLGIYKGLKNNGIFNYTDNAEHWIRIILKDFAGNTSMLVFKVKGSSIDSLNIPASTLPVFDCLSDNKYTDEHIKINIPANSLYDDIEFKISSSTQQPETYSPLYHIQDEEIALQKPYTLSIKTSNLPPHLQSKAILVSLNKKGNHHYIGGEFYNGWVTANTRTFGNYTVVVDTVPPAIKPEFKTHRRNIIDFVGDRAIRLTIFDDFSGINTYRATIDGKWVLCEYDVKTSSVFYTFDGRVKPGDHIFRMEVSDHKNNTSFFDFNFKR